VLEAVAKTAKGMRAQLGESLSAIQKLDAPADQVTTSSLNALQAWTLARAQSDQGFYLKAIPFLQRATELDPNFAIAWRHWAACKATPATQRSGSRP
jgi:hypothetical protein